MVTKIISNWGNYPKVKSTIAIFSGADDLRKILLSNKSIIARGMGRSYGDASLGENILSTVQHNKIIAFDAVSGIIDCESGASLEKILELIIPKGWFLPVTPGTKFVSIGGAIAADIHGKNHHVHGSFSVFVESFSIMIENGDVLQCSKKENIDLYNGTFGGMGLTGIILDAKIRLRKIETSFILQKVTPCRCLEETLREIDKSSECTYSVAWIDCFANNAIGKGVLFTGEHASAADLDSVKHKDPLIISHKLKFLVPFYFPTFVLNKWSIRLFNWFYYWIQSKKAKTNIVGYDPFFYPLDGIKDWNKIYGRKGFVQYQMVLPTRNGPKGLTQILKLINKKGYGSFLCVLKLLGPKSGIIAFPEPGYTLALDFPANDKVFELIRELDEIVQGHEGKIYLAKDACLEKHNFTKMYDRIGEFQEVCEKYNPNSKFRSRLSQRLNLTK